MTYRIPLNEPAKLILGDTWTWQRSLPDYPSNVWTLTYYFKRLDFSFSVLCTSTGQDFLATVAAATTAGYRPGRYRWVARVNDGSGNKYTAIEGETDLEIDPAAVGNVDFRTTAQKIVEALTQLSVRRAGGRQQVSIDGVSVVMDTQADIIRSLTYWQGVVESEQNADRIAKGLGSRRTIRVRM